ncbi:hypothetical protein E5Q_00408 [Mixia osmundae IAM 14324]|uniref:Uncharacterized protein n=1 Tax=Mixia osmundae (strain CBS 9802 / IAM 14324 / JCM 22182 / KY 12970) TaxID=764103 RepID=G7DTB5_MIXOS|nr:hypothetical protein E5Q_00408 [Mixia osmundae IAM 14324]
MQAHSEDELLPSVYSQPICTRGWPNKVYSEKQTRSPLVRGSPVQISVFREGHAASSGQAEVAPAEGSRAASVGSLSSHRASPNSRPNCGSTQISGPGSDSEDDFVESMRQNIRTESEKTDKSGSKRQSSAATHKQHKRVRRESSSDEGLYDLQRVTPVAGPSWRTLPELDAAPSDVIDSDDKHAGPSIMERAYKLTAKKRNQTKVAHARLIMTRKDARAARQTNPLYDLLKVDIQCYDLSDSDDESAKLNGGNGKAIEAADAPALAGTEMNIDQAESEDSATDDEDNEPNRHGPLAHAQCSGRDELDSSSEEDEEIRNARIDEMSHSEAYYQASPANRKSMLECAMIKPSRLPTLPSFVGPQSGDESEEDEEVRIQRITRMMAMDHYKAVAPPDTRETLGGGAQTHDAGVEAEAQRSLLQTSVRDDTNSRLIETGRITLSAALTHRKPANSSQGLSASTPAALQIYPPSDERPQLEITTRAPLAARTFILGQTKDGRLCEIPASINRFLRNYQREGAQSLFRHYNKTEGALLCDDMGLGKTIQVIAFLSAIMAQNGTSSDALRRTRHIREHDKPDKPTQLGPTALIIVPLSVIDNWAREITTWSFLSIGIYRGSERKQALQDFKNGYADVLIAGQDTVRNEIESFADLDLTCIILDECHTVKNADAQKTVAYHQFTCQIRFGLTGTAMQNRFSELHTILDWCLPTRVGTPEQWKVLVTDPIQAAQSKTATPAELSAGRIRAQQLAHNLLPHYMLRRTKAIIADQLPSKVDKIIFCPMAPRQLEAYLCALRSDKLRNAAISRDPCAMCNSGLEFRHCCLKAIDADWFHHILPGVQLLLKIANHIVLIHPDRRLRKTKPERYEKERGWYLTAFPGTAAGQIPGPDFIHTTDRSLCGKWEPVAQLLYHFSMHGDKVLLFSRSKRLLDALETWINEDYPTAWLRLDGSTPSQDRLGLCDEFNTSARKFVFLISTAAGGVGLNLVGANKVIIFDPNWNPALDLQAQDRAFRWGQIRDVEVFRLVASGTLEEVIYARQIYKQQQTNVAYTAANERRYFAGVQDSSKTSEQGDLFGCKNLFAFRGDDITMTEASIEDCNMEELEYLYTKVTADQAKDDEAAGAFAAGLRKTTDEDPLAPASADVGQIDIILNSVGINYTHAHNAVIGESNIERKRTRDAIKQELRRVGDARSRTARPANYQSEPQEERPMPNLPATLQQTSSRLSASEWEMLIAAANHADPRSFNAWINSLPRKKQAETFQALLRQVKHA